MGNDDHSVVDATLAVHGVPGLHVVDAAMFPSFTSGPSHAWRNATRSIAACLVSGFDGAILSLEWKEALWTRSYTAAPQRQRRSVEQYNMLKRA